MSEQTGSPTLEGSTGTVRSHPVFARVYEKVAKIGERRGGGEHRQRLLAGLSGRVVEVGAGSGANFAHYPTTVDEVVAVEPERYLRERAQRAAAQAPVSVSVVDGGADRLPGEAGSFDAGVAALVLCTVPDQRRALAELFRVIRPGGELRFYEHVVGHSKWESRYQRFADATFWPHVAGGCHLARDTKTGIEQAGFVIETCERFQFSPAPFLAPDPHILGTARRP
jgi:ubiquinone/menaquinone biosynthesis C-methylase UbiE